MSFGLREHLDLTNYFFKNRAILVMTLTATERQLNKTSLFEGEVGEELPSALSTNKDKQTETRLTQKVSKN